MGFYFVESVLSLGFSGLLCLLVNICFFAIDWVSLEGLFVAWPVGQNTCTLKSTVGLKAECKAFVMRCI